MEQGASSQSSAPVLGAAIGQKKKRLHGSAAAAIAARRAGHGHGSGRGTTANTADDEEASFISSSRDASEEDNDEASGYSDSASSLRLTSAAAPQDRVASPLPTSARDKALVESRDAHRRPVAASADKTPLSSSPSRHASSNLIQSTTESPDVVEPSHTLPSEGLDHPNANVVLSRATAALSEDRGLEPRTTATEGSPSDTFTPIPAASHTTPRSTLPHLARQGSSADSEASDAGLHPCSRDPKLSLGSLPAPAGNFAAGASGHLSATTPKALAEAQREAVPLSTIREARRKGSNSMQVAVPVVEAMAVKRGGSESDDEATDGAAASPYDGDVEFAAARSPIGQQPASLLSAVTALHGTSSGAPPQPVSGQDVGLNAGSTAPVDVQSHKLLSNNEPSVRANAERPVPMASVTNIRAFVYRAINEPDPARTYKINAPPDGGKNASRPVRIYADGVYDLFHYAHALQLRQAKLSFPTVHLIVGVVSSEVCEAHKNLPVMTSQERYAAVRNCRWVDEVVEDAPWVITQDVLDRLAIDYVAHDELPYAGAGSSAEMADVYHFAKDQGRFLPTQRTDGVSTSELLARIVEQYRNHNYDKKLAKIGHEELAFE